MQHRERNDFVRSTYPFSALVGQEELKRALLLNAVDPGVGGALLMGDRGTGKSTAVRALARVLPLLTVRPGCVFHCDPALPGEWCDVCRSAAGLGDNGAVTEEISVPVVDLPLGATEDRVLGSLDLGKALGEAEIAFEPGLLAAAHRGFLYIDEVNLLDDALVDLLLDAVASGVNVVEREGMSVKHAARVVLIGSGNPEEGELRPQLLDRFGLYVDVGTPGGVEARVEVLRRREQFERDPAAFREAWAAEEEDVRRRIVAARARLDAVELPDRLLESIVRLCAHLDVDGHRGEITIMRAARARAALEGRREVRLEDVRAVAGAALRHRLRRDPVDTVDGGERVDRALTELDGEFGELDELPVTAGAARRGGRLEGSSG